MRLELSLSQNSLCAGKENKENAEAAILWGSSLSLKADDTPRPLAGNVWIREKLRSE